jgi:membrane associated rhomboid family serine protease
MNFNISDKKHFFNTLLLSSCLIIIIVLVFIVEKGLGLNLYFMAVSPRTPEGLLGVLTSIFVHGDAKHLFNNCLSLFILTASLFYFYRRLADKIFVLCWIFSGLLLWVIGRSSFHIGASGLIYALAFFLCISGFLRQYVPLIAISLVVVFLYGNMVWHVFPWQKFDPVSWEGHLSGAVVGTTLAFIYRKEGPQRPIKIWTANNPDLEELAESYDLEGEEPFTPADSNLNANNADNIN